MSSPRLLHTRAYLHGLITAPVSLSLQATLRDSGVEPGDEGSGAILIAPLAQLNEGPQNGSLRVALFDGRMHREHAGALERDPPLQLLACRAPGGLPTAWEVRLLMSLLNGAPLLAPPAPILEEQVGQVEGVQSAARRAAAVVLEAGGGKTAAIMATDVMHELAANALFDAPAGADGAPRYAHRRGEAVDFAPEDACQVAIQVADGRVLLSATDRFGRLTAAPFAAALAGLDGRAKVNGSGGGAGLGLRRMLEQSDAIAVRVRPGKLCQVVCAVDLGDARRRAASPKSLFFYVDRG